MEAAWTPQPQDRRRQWCSQQIFPPARLLRLKPRFTALNTMRLHRNSRRQNGDHRERKVHDASHHAAWKKIIPPTITALAFEIQEAGSVRGNNADQSPRRRTRRTSQRCLGRRLVYVDAFILREILGPTRGLRAIECNARNILAVGDRQPSLASPTICGASDKPNRYRSETLSSLLNR